MRVTIKTLLNLPSLSHARVVAGEGGLDQTVDSISVLEYAEPTALQKSFFNSNEFYGNEIAITGFINIKDDIKAQCQTIKRLHQVGEVGIILYYVGIFMPKIDQKLIDLCNQLDFTLICMPENRIDIKYSEVIYEVIEIIVKNKLHDPYFVSEMLERISKLPDHQRSMDTILRLVSDRMTCSLYLVDSHFNNLNIANWPAISTITIHKIASYYRSTLSSLPVFPTTIAIERDICICSRAIQSEDASPLYLIMVKENGLLSMDLCDQAEEIIQLFINIWSRGHGKIGTDELVKAILNDEPIKMRRLAEILNINVKAVHHLVMIKTTQEHQDEKKQNELLATLQNTVTEVASLYFDVTFTGIYNDTFVLFLGGDKTKQACNNVREALLDMLSNQAYILVTSYGQANTTEVRRSFLLCNDYLSSARLIFPLKKSMTLQELEFAKYCYEIITKGERSIVDATSILTPLIQDEDFYDALCHTLTVYLLDAASNVTLTSTQLFVHKNTIKYRIRRINEQLKFDINKMPEHYNLYRAVAIRRLFEGQHNK